MRAVLRLSSYRRLVAAYALNELAWSVASLALALVVYGRTGSAVGATVFFLSSQFVPALVSPALVARVDRVAVRRVLVVLYALQALAFLALVRVTSPFALVAVLVLVAFGGAVGLAARAIARASTAAVIAPVGLLREGNAISNAVFALCIMAGPMLGGIIVLVGGTSAALLANSGIFVAIAVMFAAAGELPGAVSEGEPTAGRVKAAIALASEHRAIRALLGLQGAALVFFTMSIPVEVVFAQHSLRAGAGGYGALLSAWGAGAVAGSAAYLRWRRLPARTLIVASSVLLGVGFLVMAVAPSLWVAIVGSALGGVANGVEAVAVRTALQERVPQGWMALILSLNESMFQALPGAGILLGGAIAALAGPRAAFAVGGAGALAIAALAPNVLAAHDAPSTTNVRGTEPDDAIVSP
ncbi:MAG: MFS transporter [Solirubrobacteraceae bacterium]